MNTQILEKLGFTKGEIKVYFSLLELGDVSSGIIIKKSGIAGSKVYEILDKLKEKGLVSETIKDRTKHFRANSPKRILEFIKNKERDLKEEKIEFIKILPELISKYKLKLKNQEVRVYEGYRGIKTFYEEMADSLTNKDEYLGFAFPEEAVKNKFVIHLFDRYHEKRARTGGKSKILVSPKDILNKQRLAKPLHKLYEFRITKSPFPAGISIFKDIVATFSWGNPPRLFAIKCKENADEYKRFFYELWKKTEKYY